MIIFWLILGALVASAFWFVYLKFQVAGKISKTKWVLTLISVLWGAFTIAWIVSSLAEAEIQAAGMGLLIFGGIFLCLILLTVKWNDLISKLTFKNNAKDSAIS